mgnify:CR=1 FL=1
MGFINFIAELLKDPRTAIASWIAAGPLMAYGCVFLIIFIETGVVFFPFLPGDSLLFASGFFAHNGGFNIVALLATAWAAAILGDQCNFMIGHFFGRKIIASGKVKAMTPERIKKSEDFLDKWGHLAIFLGRFFPFIRTFVPFIAGMGGMIELFGKTPFRLADGFGSGFGFDGVAIALIAQLNPIGALIVALLFGILSTGGTMMQSVIGVPTAIVDIIRGMIIIFAVAGMAMVKLPKVKAFLSSLGSKNKKAEVTA